MHVALQKIKKPEASIQVVRIHSEKTQRCDRDKRTHHYTAKYSSQLTREIRENENKGLFTSKQKNIDIRTLHRRGLKIILQAV